MEENAYLECEKRWVYVLLILVAGFYGGYTLAVRGGVFCNGQTGNLALLAVSLGSGDWRRALYYLIPIGAYMAGIVVSETIPRHVRWLHLRWDTLLTLIEIVVVAIMGFIPATWPHQICQVTINFICAMQYNTFRQAEGLSMATTFCVNHMRVVGVALSRIALKKTDKYPTAVWELKSHSLMIGSFLLGAVLAGAGSLVLGVGTIWLALIPLAVLAWDLVRADLVTQKEMVSVPPRGH